MPEYYIGTSGWHYEHWRGLFYPEKLPKVEWLKFYARYFNTVEINNSFYHLPSEKAFNQWRESVQAHFSYSVKVNRFITHIKRLRNSEILLENFFSRAQLLGNKLGVLLYQLPPQMERNDKTLESFLILLPPEFRHVFEFRHESWIDESVFALLKSHDAGFCIFDMPRFTCPLVATSDFAYVRLHGSKGLYQSRYSEEELSRWACGIAEIGKGLKEVYIYFNNDAEAYAITNAQRLKQILVGE
jgi:uncharacterized protein YecE (DUF72 family)